MSLEELQDYAVKLEESNSALTDQVTNLTQDKTELQDLNKTLQRRNNELFLKVEQQHIQPPTEAEPEPVQTCEELASSIYKEIIK